MNEPTRPIWLKGRARHSTPTGSCSNSFPLPTGSVCSCRTFAEPYSISRLLPLAIVEPATAPQ